ncbi:MAG: bifunctional nuclease family protein [Deltaproteobacteria bacterium]|nr:bifunctional nuclease family protein [Deltaproteobacteria bacterium]
MPPVPTVGGVPSPSAGPVALPAPTPLLGTEQGPPAGYVTMRALRVAATPQGAAVLLVDAAGAKVVPIFIGDGEALSIHLRLSGRRAQRPLTHDLMDSTLRELGARLVHVRVDRIEGGVFFGTVVLQQGPRAIAIDARPSDAIALAVGNAVPIHVAPAVIAEAGLGAEALDAPPAPEPRQTL